MSTPSPDLPSDPLLHPGSFIDGSPELDSAMDDQDLSTPKNATQAQDAVHETPSWLPEGWTMLVKVRGSGVTAGSIDRYYVEPTSGRLLRSRNEVEYFLQHGTKKKRTITPADSATDVQPSETPKVSKKKKSSSGSKKSRPLNFDFENVPEMITWKLKDASNDNWVPYVDDKMVSNSIRQEWDAAFKSLTSGSSSPM